MIIKSKIIIYKFIEYRIFFILKTNNIYNKNNLFMKKMN